MATYKYTGNTYQNAVGHANKLVAIKVDVGGNPVFSILDETSADGAGAFTLQWEDWSGRVIIGAVDDDGTIQQLQSVFHDYLTGEQFTSYENLVVGDAPVAYYKLDETSGTTAVDSSGNNNNGTYTNGPTLNQASLVQGETSSVTFDGVDDQIVGPDLSSVYQLPITLECWCNQDVDAVTGGHMIVTNESDVAAPGFFGVSFRHRPDSDRFSLRLGDGAGFTSGVDYMSVTTTATFPKGVTYHAVAVIESPSVYRIYVNGVEQPLNTPTGTVAFIDFSTPGNPLSVGSERTASGDYTTRKFKGRLDEVAIYNNKVLTAAEIVDHYNLGKYETFAPDYNLAITVDGPDLYYKLDETSGTTVTDSSGNANDGTYAGAPTLNQTTLVQGETSSVTFDGVDDAVEGPSLGALTFPVTLEMWGKKDSESDYVHLTTHNPTPVGGETFVWYGLSLRYYPNGTVSSRIGDGFADGVGGQGYHDHITSNTFEIGTPHHLVAVFNSANDVDLYVDGQLQPTITNGLATSVNWSTGNVTINKDFESGAQQYRAGQCDEAAIYYRALTPTEITEHYRLGAFGTLLPTYSEIVLTDGPVAYYKLDETSGTTATDSSGNTNDATYNGGITLSQTTLVSGEPTSVRLDGSTGSIDTLNQLDFGSQQEFSIEAWINLDVLSKFHAIFDKRENSGANQGIVFGVRDTNVVDFYIRDSATNLVSTQSISTISASTTYHVVVTCNRNTDIVSIYINGALDNTGDISTVTGSIASTNNGIIGNKSVTVSSWDYLDGFLDEVAFYNKVLTEQEIQDHYLRGAYGSLLLPTYNEIVLSNGPLVYYKLDETSGTVAADSSGNANNGTYTNGPTLNQKTLVQGEPASVSFDDTDDYINGPSLGTLTLPVTLEAWAMVSTSGGALISTHNANTSQSYHGITLNANTSGGGSVVIGDGDAGAGVDGRKVYVYSNATTIGTTHHYVAVIRSKDDVSVYIDAAEQTLTASGTADQIDMSTGVFTVGRHTDGTLTPEGRYFGGSIDEVALYERELTAQEIQDHHLYGRVGSFLNIQDANYPITSAASWTLGRGTSLTVDSGRLAADGSYPWYNQEISLTAEQKSLIAGGDYQLTAQIKGETVNTGEELRFFIVYKDASGNNIGSVMRPFDNFSPTKTVTITQWINKDTNSVDVYVLADGAVIDYIHNIDIFLHKHATRKAQFMHANDARNLVNDFGFTITAGGFAYYPGGQAGVINPYPIMSGNANDLCQAHLDFVPDAEALAAIAAGNAKMELSFFSLNWNNDDLTRMYLQARVGTTQTAILDSGDNNSLTIGEVINLGKLDVPTNTDNIRIAYDFDRVDGTWNDASVTNVCAILEYDV